MPDSFHVLFLRRSLAGRPARQAATQLSGLAINDTEFDIGEAHEPVARLGLGDAYGLADQRFADEQQLTAPLDLAIGAHPADGMVSVIPGFLDLAGIAPGRGSIEPRRRHLAQGFVRPVVVEVVAEAVEADLLLGQARRRRTRCLGLERAMHALMPAVLLRLARINPLQPDAELDPVRRQPRQPASAVGERERAAVVGADGVRQAEFAESLVDRGQHRLDRLRHDAAFDQESAEAVAQRQRIAALAVGRTEPALEVDAPKIVGRAYRQEWLPHRMPGPPP